MVILEGRDAVRKRPGMYFGGPGETALTNILGQILHFAKAHSAEVRLDCFEDGTLRVAGDGDIALADFTEFRFTANGMRIACVNYVARTLRLVLHSPAERTEVCFEEGVQTSLTAVEQTSTRATWEFTLLLDDRVLSEIVFPAKLLDRECRLLAYLNPQFTIWLNGQSIRYPRGLADFVTDLNWHRPPLHEPLAFIVQHEAFWLDVAMQYTDTFDETNVSFVNYQQTPEHGVHLEGVQQGIGRLLVPAARSFGQRFHLDITESQRRRGLTLAVHLRTSTPSYHGARKARLTNVELLDPIAAATEQQLSALAPPDLFEKFALHEHYTIRHRSCE